MTTVGGHGLARAWSLFGAPQVVDFCRFQYVLRASDSGAIVTAELNMRPLDPLFMLGGKGPDLSAALDLLEQELNAAHPVTCSLDLPCDGFDLTLGFRTGAPFVKVRLDS